MGAFRCLCAAEREPPSLPRHTWHSPLGFHILEAKVFAGWHGYVLLMRAEREEARQINERIKAKSLAWQSERSPEQQARSSAADSPEARKLLRRSSLQAARAAEVGGQKQHGREDEMAYIHRLIETNAHERELTGAAIRRRDSVRAGIAVELESFFDDDVEPPSPQALPPPVTPPPPNRAPVGLLKF